MQYGQGGNMRPGGRRSLLWPFLFCFLLCRLLMPLPPERMQRELSLLDRISIVCISDTLGQHRKLHIPRADILIHSGGFAHNKDMVKDFDEWLGHCPHPGPDLRFPLCRAV